MSILIKGMEIPQVGDKIEFVQNIAGHIYARFEPSKGYMCEVVPIPEKHGRLIDAEAFVDYVQIRYDNNEITNGDWIDFRLSLKDQPTIVPAEGGKR